MVSIITVNYNGYKDTCELLNSLVQYETYPHEVIVVDNASRGDDGEKLKEKYPHTTIVCSARNLGFAGGNNLGYKYAKGDYIVYMNNDMTIQAPFLEPLIKRLESSVKIGAVSPKIKYEYAPDIIQYAGFSPMSSITVRNHLIGASEQDHNQYPAKETNFIHGACVLTSRSILEKVGSMTEVYFLFYEELDWSIQLQRFGYDLWFEPFSVVYHKESMSIQQGTPVRNYYLTRSRMLFTRRNRKGLGKLLACGYQVCVSYPINLLRYVMKRDWKGVQAVTKGLLEGITIAKHEK